MLLQLGITSFSCTNLEEQEYKYVILCHRHSSIQMACAWIRRGHRGKAACWSWTQATWEWWSGEELFKKSPDRLASPFGWSSSWSMWFIFGDAPGFFSSYKFLQGKQNFLSSAVGLLGSEESVSQWDGHQFSAGPQQCGVWVQATS